MSIGISEAFGRVERKPLLTQRSPQYDSSMLTRWPTHLALGGPAFKADRARARNSPLTVDLASLSHLVITNSLTAMDEHEHSLAQEADFGQIPYHRKAWTLNSFARSLMSFTRRWSLWLMSAGKEPRKFPRTGNRHYDCWKFIDYYYSFYLNYILYRSCPILSFCVMHS
jgi:hypothetical protein